MRRHVPNYRKKNTCILKAFSQKNFTQDELKKKIEEIMCAKNVRGYVNIDRELIFPSIRRNCYGAIIPLTRNIL